MIDFRIIWNDDRTWHAIDRLLDEEFCEENVLGFLQHICMLPEFWESFNTETPAARKERRDKLTKQVKLLADLIKNDDDAKHYRLFGDGITTSPIISCTTIYDLLYNFSEHVKDNNSSDIYNKYLPESKSTRHAVASFMRQDIAVRLFNLLPEQAPRPIAATTLLTNVILSNCNEKEITTEQTKETYRNIERQKNIRGD